MTPEAKERLNRLALVKPEQAKQVEDMIIQKASSGQITTRLDEKGLIYFLEQLSDVQQQSGSITFKRKVNNFDDDLDIDI